MRQPPKTPSAAHFFWPSTPTSGICHDNPLLLSFLSSEGGKFDGSVIKNDLFASFRRSFRVFHGIHKYVGDSLFLFVVFLHEGNFAENLIGGSWISLVLLFTNSLPSCTRLLTLHYWYFMSSREMGIRTCSKFEFPDLQVTRSVLPSEYSVPFQV